MVHPAYQNLIEEIEESCLPIEFEDYLGEELYKRSKESEWTSYKGGTFLVLYYQEEPESILTGATLLPSGHHETFTDLEPGWKAYVEIHNHCLPDYLVNETVFRVI